LCCDDTWRRLHVQESSLVVALMVRLSSISATIARCFISANYPTAEFHLRHVKRGKLKPGVLFVRDPLRIVIPVGFQSFSTHVDSGQMAVWSTKIGAERSHRAEQKANPSELAAMATTADTGTNSNNGWSISGHRRRSRETIETGNSSENCQSGPDRSNRMVEGSPAASLLQTDIIPSHGPPILSATEERKNMTTLAMCGRARSKVIR